MIILVAAIFTVAIRAVTIPPGPVDIGQVAVSVTVTAGTGPYCMSS